MRRIMMGIGSLAACALLVAASAPPELLAQGKEVTAGVVIDVRGKPRIVRRKDAAELDGISREDKDKAGQRLKTNKFVYEGDVIITGRSDRAAVAFVGGAEVRINSNSEFVVESGGGRRPTSLFTRVGQAWTRMLHGKSGMNIRTPLAVAAVRGTEADVDMGQRLDVKVYEGHVDVSNKYGTQTLRAGMMTSVSGPGVAPAGARRMGEGDQGSWQNALQPKAIEKKLQRLQQKADKERKVQLKYMQDGKPEELNLELEKK
ncbi:MAG: FecR family protein [Elusimicrobiota bacterium]